MDCFEFFEFRTALSFPNLLSDLFHLSRSREKNDGFKSLRLSLVLMVHQLLVVSTTTMATKA